MPETLGAIGQTIVPYGASTRREYPETKQDRPSPKSLGPATKPEIIGLLNHSEVGDDGSLIIQPQRRDRDWIPGGPRRYYLVGVKEAVPLVGVCLKPMQKRGFQTFIPRRDKRPVTYDPYFIPPGEHPKLTRYQKQRLKRANRLERLRKRS